MSELIAWAAGLFEGEGCLSRRTIGKRVYLEMAIEMRDQDIIERFVEVAKGVTQPPDRYANGKSAAEIRRRHRGNPRHSAVYSWHVSGSGAELLFGAFKPYLGERRMAKGEDILAESHALKATALRPRNCEECGTSFGVQDHGHNKRFCSARCRYRAKMKRPGQREALRARQLRWKAKQGTAPGTDPLGELLRWER